MTLKTMNCRIGLFTAALLFLAVGDLCAEQPAKETQDHEVRVLGIGNSFTGNAFALLGPMSERCDKCRLVIGRAIIGGCSMEKHMRLAKLHDANPGDPEGLAYSIWTTNDQGKRVQVKVGLKGILTSDMWDVVAIQQLSRESVNIASYRPYSRELYDYIKKYAPQAEVAIHQTWAYRSDGDFDKVFPEKVGYGQEEMFADLKEAYDTIAAELDVRLIPVGAAFQSARVERPFVADTATDRTQLKMPALPGDDNSLCVGWRWRESEGRQLLRCDTHHAGERGKYLAAAVWFEFLTGLNPFQEKIRVGDIPDEDARFLSSIAHEAIVKKGRPALEAVR